MLLFDIFEEGAHILELNCGTGEDALFLARHDMSVVACDGSEGMIRTARKRMQDEDPDAPIQFKFLPTEHLAQASPRHTFRWSPIELFRVKLCFRPPPGSVEPRLPGKPRMLLCSSASRPDSVS